MKVGPLRARTAVGRADLLRVYAEHGEEMLAQAAWALGYERRPAPPLVTAFAKIVASPVVEGFIEAGPPYPNARQRFLPPASSTSPNTGRPTRSQATTQTLRRAGWLQPICSRKTPALFLARCVCLPACR